MATLRDLGSGGPVPLSGGGGGRTNSDDDEDDENDENEEGESWFAGGERRYVIDWQRIRY